MSDGLQKRSAIAWPCWFFPIGFILTLALALQARPELKVRGNLEVGAETSNRGFFLDREIRIYNYDFNRILRARLKTRIQFSPWILGFADFTGDVDQPGVLIDDLGFRFGENRISSMTVGNIKKVFGLEEMTSRERLPTLKRSLVHEYLASFGAQGRDLSVLGTGRIWREWSLYADGGGDGDARAFLNLRFAQNEVGRSVAGTALMYIYHHHQNSTLLGEVDMARSWRRWYADLEIFAGNDPNESNLSEHFGENRSVLFAAGKSTATRSFLIARPLLQTLEAVSLIAVILTDTEPETKTRFQWMPGLNLYLDSDSRVRWMNSVECTFVNNGVDPDLHRWSYWLGSQIQARW